MKLGTDIWGRSIVGARESQQDCFRLLLDEELGTDKETLVVLADGMGGHVGGAEASRIVVDSFARAYRQAGSDGRLRDRLKQALHAANDAVRDAVAANEPLRGMGSTVAAVVVRPERVIWASVGDSPIWLWRHGRLRRLNADHSLRSELDGLVAAGRMTAEEAARHPQRNALRSAICGEPLQLTDIGLTELSAGDIVLLGSDGVQTLSEAAVVAILDRHERDSAADLVERCLSEVERSRVPHQDNATLVICKYGGSSLAARLGRAIPLGVVYGAVAGLILIGAGVGTVALFRGDPAPAPPEQGAETEPAGDGPVGDPQDGADSAAIDGDSAWQPVAPGPAETEPLPAAPPEPDAIVVEPPEPDPIVVEPPPPIERRNQGPPRPAPKPPKDVAAVAPAATESQPAAPTPGAEPQAAGPTPAPGPAPAEPEGPGAREGAAGGGPDDPQQPEVEEDPRQVEDDASDAGRPRQSVLVPKNFIDGTQLPQDAYALLALTKKPEPETRERYLDICRAFRATLAAPPVEPDSQASDRSTITFWPMQLREAAAPTAARCDDLIDGYDFFAGVSAANAAGLGGIELKRKRGPFLIGLELGSAEDGQDRPAEIVDLSEVDGEAGFRKEFAAWRSKVTKNGAYRHDRFAPPEERSRAARDLPNRRGEAALENSRPG